MIRRDVLFSSCLLLAVLLVFGDSLRHPFHFDDQIFLRDDNVLLGRWWELVWPPALRFLTWLTYLAQAESDPSAFHLVNLLLHAANAILVYFLLSRLIGRLDVQADSVKVSWTALSGALLFALHPVQSEPIFYIYQRSTLLAAFFSMLSLWAFLECRRGLAFVCFLLAAASKEFVILLPLIWWGVARVLWAERRPPAITGPGLSVSAGLGLFYAWSRLQEVESVVRLGWMCLSYLADQVFVFWYNLALIFLIREPNIDHDPRTMKGAGDGLWWLALVLLVCFLLIFFLAARRSKIVALAGLLTAGFLLPTSSVIPSPDRMFDHRLYLPMLGASLLFSAGVSRLVRGPAPRIRGTLVLASLLLLAVLTSASVTRSVEWGDPVRLWRDAVRKSPAKFRPRFNLAMHLTTREPEEALRHLELARALAPREPAVQRALGEIHFRLGQDGAAEEAWQEACRLEPGEVGTQIALGRLALRQNEFFRAKRYLEAAVASDPSSHRAYVYLVLLHLRFGLVEEAVVWCEAGLRVDLEHGRLRSLLVECMLRTKNLVRALELARENVSKNPSAETFYQLARVRLQTGRMEAAESALSAGLKRSETPQEASRGWALRRVLDESIAGTPRRDGEQTSSH